MTLLPSSFLLSLVLLWGASAAETPAGDAGNTISRNDFPAEFVFGTASSAYQYEGAAREGGKGPSIWDTFTHTYPEKIVGRSNGDVAVDFYHRYKEDVQIMKKMGLNAFRFSISWPRILPNGTLSGGVNKEGVQFYNNLIDELLSNGLQPFVTLFHWDAPESLEQHYGGFLSPNIIDDFHDYAEVCFREFGDRVKHWITLNEPSVYSIFGYAMGLLAPGRCTPGSSRITNCTGGDSGKEPYIVGHHLLLAHAAAADVYRNKYQASQKGKIGISLAVQWVVPISNSNPDTEAAQRSLDFSYGWFMDPLTYGDYPLNMRLLVGDRLPCFTKEQSKSIKGSFDFIGVNYYTANYASSVPVTNILEKNYLTDSFTNITATRNGIPIGPLAGSSWIYMYPRGIRDVLEYTMNRYNNPVIYITENGVDDFHKGTMTLEEALKDDKRIEYHYQHLLNVQKAIWNGVDVRGYFAWSLLDNFEWGSGYTVRFGIHYVDYNDGLKRYAKSSGYWFQKFLQVM